MSKKSKFTDFINKEYVPKITSLKDDIKARQNKDYFWPNGVQVYCGKQGSGKTISAVKHLHDIKKRYPKAIIVSNLDLKNYTPRFDLDLIKQNGFDPVTEYIQFHTMEELSKCLTNINNDIYGVIYIIDEIHTYFNALDSKNIPMYVFTEISQQRKQRKLIIGTSQLFLRMAKPLREQCDSLVMCNTKLGIFTTQKAYDGMTLTQDYDGTLHGDLKKKGGFFHTPQVRSLFDTYQKVVSGQQQFEEFTRIEENKKKSIFKKH